MANAIGCNTIVFGRRIESKSHALRALDVVAEFGFAGVEFGQTPLEAYIGFSNSSDLLSELNVRGLKLLGLTGGSIRDKMQFLREYKEAYLCTDEFGPDALEAIRLGYRVAIHPHAHCRLDTLLKAREILDSCPSLQLITDTAHAAVVGDDPVEAISEYGSRIAAIHLRDWDGQQGVSSYRYSGGFCNLGQGRLDRVLRGVVEKLRHMAEPIWAIWALDHPMEGLWHAFVESSTWLKSCGFTTRIATEAASGIEAISLDSLKATNRFSGTLKEDLFTTSLVKVPDSYSRVCETLMRNTHAENVELLAFVASHSHFLFLKSSADLSEPRQLNISCFREAVESRVPVVTLQGNEGAEGIWHSIVSIPILDVNNPDVVHYLLNLYGSPGSPVLDPDGAYTISNDVSLALFNSLQYTEWETASWINCAASKCDNIEDFCELVAEHINGLFDLASTSVYVSQPVGLGSLKGMHNASDVSHYDWPKFIDKNCRNVIYRDVQLPKGNSVGTIACRPRGGQPALLDDDKQFILDAISFSAGRYISFMIGKRQRDRLRICHLHSIRQPLLEIRGMVNEIKDIAAAKQIEFRYDFVGDFDSYIKLVSKRCRDDPQREDYLRILERIPTFLIRDVLASVTRQISEKLVERRFSQYKIDFSALMNIPKLMVDRNGFQRVFFNLLVNSIKYAYEDPDAFEVEISGRLTPEKVVITFGDYGTGIEPSDAERIFDFGYRSSNAKAEVKGEGYGLYFVREIIRSHGGDIRLSNSKFPTEFEIVLPRSIVKIPIEGI